MAKNAQIARCADNSVVDYRVAANSLAVEQGNILKYAATGAALAGAGDAIIGVSQTKKTFAASNFATEQEEVAYRPTNADANMTVILENSGTIATTDVGKYYNLAAPSGLDQLVDGATGATAVGALKLQLVRFIDATHGEYAFV